MKYIYIFTTIFFISLTVNGQVKIGNNTAPEAFSPLEIDALKESETPATGRMIGGLRLPQWTDATALSMVSTLTTNATESKGLLIYNTDKQYIQMWNGTAWIPLPSNSCTAVQSLTLSANQTTIDEYGTEDLVLTATPDAGESANADIVYRWTLDTHPIEGATGKTYTVKKENLSAAHSGTYQVTSYSCGYTGTIKDVVSNSLAITVTPKVYSISVSPVSPNVTADSEDISFTCTVSNFEPVNLMIVEDPEHMYDNVFAVLKASDTQYNAVLDYKKNESNRSPRQMKFRILDAKGNASDIITLTQDAYVPAGDDRQVGTYFLYGESTNQTAADAMEHCRGKVWTAPKRTSLMSVDFLNENKAELESTPSIVPDGNYWLMDGSPVMYTISYPGGSLTLAPTPGESASNLHTTRCIAPY